MSIDRRTFLKNSALAVSALVTGCATGPDGSALAASPLQTYKLGRLSVTVPSFLKPQVEKFVYIWDSRTPNNKSYHIGYPIKIYEQPYSDISNSRLEWGNTINDIMKKYTGMLYFRFEWDLSKQLGKQAHFICYQYEGAKFHFHIIIEEDLYIMHIIGSKSFRYPEKAEKNSLTDEILKVLINIYKKYRPGHNSQSGNVFHTYYGEMIDNTFNYDERMAVLFANEAGNLLWGIETHTNPGCRTEADIEAWMQRVSGYGIYSRSRMCSLPHFPGKGWESLAKKRKDKRHAHWTFEYNGPGRNAYIPSFSMGATKTPSGDMDTFHAMWDVIVQNLRPLQPELGESY